jgi:hypothetical protein
MNDIFPPEAYLTDPQKRHKSQSMWQIYLPLVIGIIAFLVVGVLVVISQTGGNPEVERWAAIAAIWLILPMLGVGLLALFVQAVMIFLVSRINTHLPDYGRLARFYLYRVTVAIQRLADKIVTPDIKLESNIAGWVKIFSIFRRM